MRRNQAVRRVRNKLAACANSSSNSGPVFPWFDVIKSCRIFDRTLFDPWSHCCNNLVTAAWSVFILKTKLIVINKLLARHSNSTNSSTSYEYDHSPVVLQFKSYRVDESLTKFKPISINSKRTSRFSLIPFKIVQNKVNHGSFLCPP